MGNFVITIGRECGSGGRTIAKMLADRLQINCYDKELLLLASEHSGLCQEILEHHDERPTNSFLYSTVKQSGLDTIWRITARKNKKCFDLIMFQYI